MTFGTADRRKADVAEGVALASATSRRGVATGSASCTFGGRAARMLPPRQGRPGLLALLLAAAREPAPDGAAPTSLGEALGARGAPRAPARRWSIVVSDFRGPRDWRAPLLAARRRATT